MTQAKPQSLFAIIGSLSLLAGVVLVAFEVACSPRRYVTFAAEPKSADVSEMMKKKLGHARELLAGLAMEDYDQLVQHARALDVLTQQRWRSEETDEYRANLKAFRFTTSELTRLAEEKNLDGATLAYVQLTTSCVTCHRQMRQKKS